MISYPFRLNKNGFPDPSGCTLFYFIKNILFYFIFIIYNIIFILLFIIIMIQYL